MSEFLEPPDVAADYVGRIVARYGDDHEIMPARSRDEFADVIVDADVAICWNISPQCFARARRLKWISFGSAGIDHTIFPELLDSDVRITTLSGVHPVAVAEHVFAILLAFSRRLNVAMAQQREHRWQPESIGDHVIELSGKSLGIIGAGRIGTQIARLGKAFGMNTSALLRDRTAPPPSPLLVKEGGIYEVFDRAYAATDKREFLAQCDFLVLSMPLTKDTDGFIDAEALSVMKPTAYLINVARARCVDENALLAALGEGRLAGAGLDVFLQEPLPPDHPFWSMENVIVTPHAAGATPHYAQRAFVIFAENMRRFLAGERMLTEYDRAKGY